MALQDGEPKSETRAPWLPMPLQSRRILRYIWRIYIEADDPDENMLRIALVADGPAKVVTHRFDLSQAAISKHFEDMFNGIPSVQKLIYQRVDKHYLKGSILDKTGNEKQHSGFSVYIRVGDSGSV